MSHRTYVVPSVRPGPSTLIDARDQFGRHARLGLSVRANGDRWWPMERDPGEHQGRHRAICSHPFIPHRGADHLGCGAPDGPEGLEHTVRCGFYRRHHPTMLEAHR
jgi:hypothetical protein